MRVRFSLQILVTTLLIPGITERDIIMRVYWTYRSIIAKFIAKQEQCVRLRLQNSSMTCCGILSGILRRVIDK